MLVTKVVILVLPLVTGAGYWLLVTGSAFGYWFWLLVLFASAESGY